MFSHKKPPIQRKSEYGFSYQIERTKRRKSISLTVDEGNVRVHAPLFSTNRHIEAIIDKHASWVMRKMDEQNARPRPPRRRFVSGEWILYLGRKYGLHLTHGAAMAQVRLKSGQVEILSPMQLGQHGRQETVRSQLEAWYKKRAEYQFKRRVAQYAAQINVKPVKISFKQYKSRWGTCTSNGEITFDWRLIMAPSAILDYVIIHELAHLRHLNHSKQFWKVVETACPDYRTARDWLRQNGALLAI